MGVRPRLLSPRLFPVILIFALLACIDPDCAMGAGSSSYAIEVDVVQAGDTPVRHVRWTTKEASTGEVRFGVDGLDYVLTDDLVGTEHDVTVLGVGAGIPWRLQAVSETKDGVITSDIVEIAATPLPSDLTEPSVQTAGAGGAGGFELLPLPAGDRGTIILINDLGQIVWWVDCSLRINYRARYNAANQTVSWMESDAESGEVELVTATLDQTIVRTPGPSLSHHDFALTPDGSFISLVLDEHDVDGRIVYSDSLVETYADGTTRVIWNSWDDFPWTGGGKFNTDGTIEYPHANSLHLDIARGKLLVSLHSINTVVQIDHESGALDWKFGGEWSDWSVGGEQFSGQHGPMSFDGENGLALMSNGEDVSPAVARIYTLDPETMVASPLLTFDHGGEYTGVLLGNVTWVGDGTFVANWGSAGVVERMQVDGGLVWSMALKLGSFAGFSEHVTDFAPRTD